MDLLDLAHDVGLSPRKVSNTQGGEYKSPCPSCGGKDRFFIQPKKQMKNCKGYFRCRQCEISGDSIEFAMKFNHMSFIEAKKCVGEGKPFYTTTKQSFRAPQIIPPANSWTIKGNAFVTWAHENLLNDPLTLKILESRGLPIQAIKKYLIGLNPLDLYRNKSDWGLICQEGESTKLWLPSGIVIPSLDSAGSVLRMKIRRSNWLPNNRFPKYIAISGSTSGLGIIGDTNKKLMIVVESELDAFALHWALSDYAFVIAVGSNVKNPDNVTDYFAKQKELLVCHDNDEPGLKMLKKWQLLYPHAIAYPTPFGKDIGEAIEQGLKLAPWILKYKWIHHPALSLIDFVLQHANNQVITSVTYRKWKEEILLGPTSPRSKSGELQKGFQLIKELLTQNLD